MGRSMNSEQDGSGPRKTKQSSSKPANKDEKERAEHQRKAELESKIRQRVALEARAFDVVNRLIEPNITAEYLLQACQFIDDKNYEDVVEERSISHLCGYPLCNNELRQVAKKKYHISSRSNTVYDITERKKFCSNRCYHASEHLHKQIPRTPVWTRRAGEKVSFHLLQQDVSSSFEGKEVIGGRMFGLKEEVLELERSDAAREEKNKTARPPRTKTTRPGGQDHRASFEESQRLSDLLQCLSVEEDMSSGSEPFKSCGAEANAASEEKGTRRVEQIGDGGRVEETGTCTQSDQSGLESALKDLRLQDGGDASDGDSDDDDYVDGVQSGVSKVWACDRSQQKPEPVVAKSSSVQQDNDDDDDDDDGDVRESGVKRGSTDDPKVATNKAQDGALKQQPGESKSAYLMRLLDRRKTMLSKVADIQSTESSRTEGSSEEEKNPSEKSNQNKEKAPSPDSDPPTSQKKKNVGTQKKPSSNTNQASEQSPLASICQAVSTWVTTETLDYLGFGSNRSVDGSESTFHKDPEMQRKYRELCQRLAGQEKDFEEMLGEEEVEEEGEKKGVKKPVPDYQQLKKETHEFQLKVQNFLAPSRPAKKKKADEDPATAENERPIFLPDVDSQNQMTIRRRIVLERLDRTMPSLLPPLGLSVQDVSASLRELVFTFSLSSHNIVFKPVEWTLAAIILLKMLESRCSPVRSALQNPSQSAAFTLVLSRLHHSLDSLDHLVRNMLTQQQTRLSQGPPSLTGTSQT